MVTIKKIAELAGVSIGTVDRALHNRAGVNPEVSRRIKEIAVSLGYEPNIMAKALSTKRKPIRIGVLFHVKPNPFYESVIEGIKRAGEELKHFGITVIIRHGADFDVSDQLRLIDEFIAEGVDGMILVPLNDVRIRDRINQLHAKDFPIVFMVSDLYGSNRLAFVGCNAFQVGRLIGGMAALVCHSVGNVLYAASPLYMLGNLQRFDGFKHILQERYPQMVLDGMYEFSNDDIVAYRQAQGLFATKPDIDVLVVVTGSLRGLFQALSESPLANRVKIVALDLAKPVLDGIQSSLVTASIVQHPATQGYRAIKVLSNYFIHSVIPDQEECYVDCDIKIFESLF
jgi:LacI family transcriptional regulator